MKLSSDLGASISLIHCNARVGFFEFERTSVRKFTIQLWNSVWSGNFPKCISEEGWLGIVMPLWVPVPIPATWWVIDLRKFLSSRLFFLYSYRKQGKGIGCNGSSLPLFSIPSLLWIPDGAAKFLESLCSSSGTRRIGWQSKTFSGILVSSRVCCCILDSRLGFLQLEGKRAWCETWALSKLLGESGSSKIFESSINFNRSCNFWIWSRN